MEMILLTSKDCVPCQVVKEHMNQLMHISIMDIDSPDGMAESAYHNIKSVPALITDSDHIVLGASSIIAYLQGVRE